MKQFGFSQSFNRLPEGAEYASEDNYQQYVFAQPGDLAFIEKMRCWTTVIVVNNSVEAEDWMAEIAQKTRMGYVLKRT